MRTHPTAPPSARRTGGMRWLGWAVAALACLAVFGLYTASDFMVMVADQLWSCF
ncbi:MAG: hypothetical protein LWW96_13350 [Acidovorax sp.]|uniref:hypothetical protein n=1 Tax=Acidovorax sp. TaxID=1872122 RepID=UPI0025C235A3|nr:hypothetical protein [Acidovorax sp.]MCE1193127.1 hypothetical protein [Acidovorax sp.]